MAVQASTPRALTSTKVSASGGLDLHQLAVVEGLVIGQGLGRGVDLDQPRGVAGGLDLHQRGLVEGMVSRGPRPGR